MYHYAGNNPVKYTDPDGKQSIYLPGGGTRFGGAPPNMKYNMTEYSKKSETIGSFIENSFSAKSADAILFCCSKLFGDDKFSKNYESYCLKSTIDFHQVMAETQASGLYDFDNDGNYSEHEIKAFANYVNSTMILNYSDKSKLGPLKNFAKTPVLSFSAAKRYLNPLVPNNLTKQAESQNFQNIINSEKAKETINKNEKK